MTRRQDFTEINITPLTDIFLVLLIIMMVIAPMLDSQGLKLAVPTLGTDTALTQDPKALTLTVSASGAYTMEGHPVPAVSLQQHLVQARPEYPEGLIIQTDPDARHEHIVHAMDAARGAGMDKIAVSQINSP